MLNVIKQRARGQKRKYYNLTLQTTEVVNETFMRMLENKALAAEDRKKFLIHFSESLRCFLIDNIRRKTADKRGGALHTVSLDDIEIQLEAPDGLQDYLLIDAQLKKLATFDPLCEQVIKLRFFVGLTLEEAARTLDIDQRTVTRKWQFGRAWMHRRIGDD